MSAQPKIYVPGQDRKADELNALYEKLGGSTLAERTSERAERDPKDPFGLEEKRELTDDYDTAKHAAEKMVKFFSLVVQDLALTPRAGMFAVELMSLIIYNAQDIPETPAAIDAARKAAYEYYVAACRQIPDIPKR